jgi:hypothetical protein
VIFLILLTLLLLPLYDGIVPYQPLQQTGAPYRDTIAGTLKIAWWLWAAWFLVALVRALVIFEGRAHHIAGSLPGTTGRRGAADLIPG